MPGGGGKPPSYNAQNVIGQDTAAKVQTGFENQGINTIDANTNYGGLNYTSKIDPITGKQDYVANLNLSPEQQAILDNLQRNQISGGEQAGELLGSQGFDQLYDNPADIIGGANSLTNQAIDKMNPAWERFMAPQRAQLDTALRNQGILPGTPAYQQQVDALTNQQLLTKGQWQTEFTPKAYEMAKGNYEEPLDIVKRLMGIGGAPVDLKSMLPNTPTTNIAAPDVTQNYKNQYDAQLKQYEAAQAQRNAMMSAGLGVAKAIMAIPTGGMSLAIPTP